MHIDEGLDAGRCVCVCPCILHIEVCLTESNKQGPNPFISRLSCNISKIVCDFRLHFASLYARGYMCIAAFLCVCARKPPPACLRSLGPSLPQPLYCDAVSLLFDGWQKITQSLVHWLIIYAISYRSTHTYTQIHTALYLVYIKESAQNMQARTN